jgi:CheY-like chemotaxis protein
MNKSSVLIMEYEDRVSRVLCRIIKRLGLEPASTDNYHDFKKLYIESRPQFILLSLDTPANNQGELCRYLVDQKSPSTIILLSNMDEEKLLGFERNGRSAGLNMELITPDQGNLFKKKVPCARVIDTIPPSILNRTGNIAPRNQVITDR